jgi:tetratricopeptide (TPR) repeat protein
MPRQKSDHVDSAAALAQRLRTAREHAGLSQRALAKGICTPAYVSRLEKGERIPSLQLLRQLADRLDADADELASGVPSVVGDPLVDAELALRLGETEEARRLFTEVLDTGRAGSRSAALAGLGQLAFQTGDHRAAIELLEEAVAARPGSSSITSAVADSLGRAYAMSGELESAIAIFEDAFEAARLRGDSIDMLRFAVLLSNALIDCGRLGRATELLGGAISTASEAQDPVLRARVWWSQSRLHAAQHDPETAARYARRALETLEMTEHTTYAARAHQLLAHMELEQGHAEEALVLLESGYPLIEQSGNRFEQAVFRLEQARAFAQLGRTEEAASRAMEASGLLAEAGPGDAGRGYALVAEVFADLGDRPKAIELYELADELVADGGRFSTNISARWAELLEQEGRKDEALELLKRAMRTQTESRSQSH